MSHEIIYSHVEIRIPIRIIITIISMKVKAFLFIYYPNYTSRKADWQGVDLGFISSIFSKEGPNIGDDGVCP